jgi:hypothetical protein
VSPSGGTPTAPNLGVVSPDSGDGYTDSAEIGLCNELRSANEASQKTDEGSIDNQDKGVYLSQH